MGIVPNGYVSCSDCGRQFYIPGRVSGFSHCDNHMQFFPLHESDEIR